MNSTFIRPVSIPWLISHFFLFHCFARWLDEHIEMLIRRSTCYLGINLVQTIMQHTWYILNGTKKHCFLVPARLCGPIIKKLCTQLHCRFCSTLRIGYKVWYRNIFGFDPWSILLVIWLYLLSTTQFPIVQHRDEVYK